MALTLCAAFRLSSYLDDVFEPAVWIVVTACFVMENQSASAVATSLLRLIGTVLVSACVGGGGVLIIMHGGSRMAVEGGGWGGGLTALASER